MTWRYFYHTDGTILSMAEVNDFLADHGSQPYLDSETLLDQNVFKIDNGEFVSITKPQITQSQDWADKRRRAYGHGEHQLALLYDDIKAGLFGEAAKTSAWFQHVTEVKQTIPKE
jgi:hypothetical protein